MGAMLSLQDVTKIYPGSGDIKSVDHLSFDLDAGEICTLVGPSGCGKTTTLKMINRLIPLSSGKIVVSGNDINTLDIIALRRSIGYVIQDIGLFPNMTIAENIAVVPKMKGWDASQIAERTKDLLELINLPPDEYMNRYPKELSGGQQQRIGLARGMAADPPIMLMDEPFGAIDPINREHLQNEFLSIQEKVKKTVVFVTHDIDEAIKMGDKICLLESGRLVQFDTPEKMLTEPADDFVRDFVGSDRALKRLNLIKIKDVMRTKPPIISQSESPAAAKAVLSAIKYDHLLVTDDNQRLLGYLDQESLSEKADCVGELAQDTQAFLPAFATLKDGLSQMLAYGLGYIVVTDDDKKILGILMEEDVKAIMKR